MPNKVTKNNEAWEQLFTQYNILDRVSNEGEFRITSEQINKIREARLMVKFDHSALLPEIFHENDLSILPITRGNYLIGHFDVYKEIECCTDTAPRQVEIPPLDTIDTKNLYSEAAALLFAYNSGIIKDVMGCSNVNFTVNGRMSAGDFSFSIKNKKNPQIPIKIAVNNPQIEIDAGFESPEAFVICEAKKQVHEDFLIRQLYYPYRLWEKKIAKPVIPVFLAFSDDIFHVFIYEFTDIQDYNSIKLKGYKRYTFADEAISSEDIAELWRSIKTIQRPAPSFPQADSFDRVLDLLYVLHKEEMPRSEITLRYKFSSRQTDYYISACDYLGLIERVSDGKNRRMYRLTSEARSIMSLPYKRKYLALFKKILERPVFYEAFQIFMDTKKLPDKNEIYRIMGKLNMSINDTTTGRRASTVLGWLRWMIQIAE